MRELTITDVQTLSFHYRSRIGRDSAGHAKVSPEHTRQQTLIRVQTSAGVAGYCFGGTPETVAAARPLIVGLNPLDREAIWTRLQHAQRMHRRTLDDRGICAVELALWDVAGRMTDLPIYRLLGGARDRIPAYASTMLGDDSPGGLATPEDFAAFAKVCQTQGYTAFKLHTWEAPYGPDVRRDIAACQAVRDAVGSEMKLMLDPDHYYSREEALYLGRALEELDFYWLEEPMDEHSIASYVWLAQNLDLPICGPEQAEGQFYTRAEWIIRGASDISRAGVWDVGGIGPTMKIVHLCEAFHMRCEIHGDGAATLQVLGAMAIPGEYYEYGLLHPLLDFDAEKPWLKQPIDALDAGFVAVPQGPGLGEEIDWDFINDNLVRDWA